MEVEPGLPHGVLRELASHGDPRGEFTEIYREEWRLGCAAVQWNVVRSASNVLRGVHIHCVHSDHFVMVSGRMRLGLHDARRWSPTWGRSVLLELDATRLRACMIPPGVAHGFYFEEPSMHVYAVSEYWSEVDELGCRFDSRGIGLDWPTAQPILSPRDDAAGSYEAMVAAFEAGTAAHGILPETAGGRA
jgi:dTDP-4-dehydrorhamnose 3,5-epimerase